MWSSCLKITELTEQESTLIIGAMNAPIEISIFILIVLVFLSLHAKNLINKYLKSSIDLDLTKIKII